MAALRTSSAWIAGSTFGHTFTTFPSFTKKLTRSLMPSVLFTPYDCAIFSVFVGGERKWQIVIFHELAVARFQVSREIPTRPTCLSVNFVHAVAKRTRLFRAAWRFVLRIKINDDGLGRRFQRAELHGIARFRRRRKIRCDRADRQKPFAAIGTFHRTVARREHRKREDRLFHRRCPPLHVSASP